MSTRNHHFESAFTRPAAEDRDAMGTQGRKSLRVDRTTVRVLRVATGMRTGEARAPSSFTYTTI